MIRPQSLRCLTARAELIQQFLAMIVKIGQSRVDFFRLQVRVLAKQLLSRPSVVEVFTGKMNHFVSTRSNAGDPIFTNLDMRVINDSHHRETKHNSSPFSIGSFADEFYEINPAHQSFTEPRIRTS